MDRAEQVRSNTLRALERVTKALPGGGEVRAGQQEMALAVAETITERGHVIVEAGTGTGKSLGYLVPAILSGAKVVVSTATKALQDQLASKDLPFLQEHLGTEFEFSVLKGRSNYFCRQKALEVTTGAAKDQLQLLGAEAGVVGRGPDPERLRDEVKRLVSWSEGTISGDRAELSFEPSAAAWAAVSVSAGECPGAAKCPAGANCFAEAARQRAAESAVVVVNTHLYGQHVRSGGYVLPDHDVVIFDEAHEVEDIMADSFGVEISAGRFAFLAARARQVIADLDSNVNLVDVGTQLEAALAPYAGQRLLQGPAAVPDLRRVIVLGMERVNRTLTLLRAVPDDAPGGVGPRKVRAVQAASGLLEELTGASELGAERTKPKMAEERIDAAAGEPDHDDAAFTAPDVEKVCWVEAETRTRGPVLRIAPIEVAPTLAATTWSNTTAVLTSATIPSSLGARLGLRADSTRTYNVGSPFDYRQQGLLYCAVHLPDPRTDRFEPAMHRELELLLRAAGGRTLALFTSWRGMKAAADAMKALQPELPFTIYTQSDLPKPALTKAFSDDETSCLFATMGYWQGIDVPGRSLSMVVIDKLPFARPDEPLLVARRERAGDAAFRLIDLPRAAMLLAQGTGRLIRARTDRGVVAVMDPRLNTAKSYRYDLLNALPAMRRTRERSEVEAFLKEIVGS